MISILFALISRLPLSVLIFLAHVFARVMIFSNSAQYKATKKNIYYCYEKDTQLVKKSFYETAELLMIFPYICGRTENYKNLIDNSFSLMEQSHFIINPPLGVETGQPPSNRHHKVETVTLWSVAPLL